MYHNFNKKATTTARAKEDNLHWQLHFVHTVDSIQNWSFKYLLIIMWLNQSCLSPIVRNDGLTKIFYLINYLFLFLSGRLNLSSQGPESEWRDSKCDFFQEKWNHRKKLKLRRVFRENHREWKIRKQNCWRWPGSSSSRRSVFWASSWSVRLPASMSTSTPRSSTQRPRTPAIRSACSASP